MPDRAGSYRRGKDDAETMRSDVRALLNAVEARSAFFDRVTTTKLKLQKTFDMPDFLALSEILQIRRDLWAASEIFLMEDIGHLGPELADALSLAAFQAEAKALLFRDTDYLSLPQQKGDPVDLRLAIAHEQALAFQAQVEEAITGQLAKSRFPTVRELVAVPVGVLRGAGSVVREVQYLLGDAAVAAQNIARAMSARGLRGATEELRRVRSELPGQFATAFERAGGLARTGGQTLKRHYEFVLEAQELRARYAELLAKAPALSEKGKQFLERLELERRAEEVRQSSDDVMDRVRQGLVAGLAHLIATLQAAQAKLTPSQHKQVTMPASVPEPNSASSDTPAPVEASAAENVPFRVLLLPASSYSGGNHGQDQALRRRQRKAKDTSESIGSGPVIPMPPPKPRTPKKPKLSHEAGLAKMSFKELLAESEQGDEDEVTQLIGEGKPPTRNASQGSLSERLAIVGREPSSMPEPEGKALHPDPKRRAGLFQGKRKR